MFKELITHQLSISPIFVMDAHRFQPRYNKLRFQQIAHEVILNPNVQMTEDNLKDFSIVIFGSTLHSYDFVVIEDELKLNTPSYQQMFSVLKKIRQVLMDLDTFPIPEKLKVFCEVDWQVMRGQLEQGTFNMGRFFDFIRDIFEIQVSLLRVPLRECQFREIFASIWESMEPVLTKTPFQCPETVSFTLSQSYRMCVLLKIDSLNKEFRSASVLLENKGVEWERLNFQERIQEGLNTTERTGALAGQIVKHMIQKTPCVLKSFLEEKNDETTKIAHAMMFLELLPKQNLFLNLPETLYLDQEKISLFQKRILHFAAVTNICFRFKTNACLGFLYSKVITSFLFIFLTLIE